MRKFNITVNGVSYEVEVEEVAAGSAPAAPAAAAPVAAAPAVAADGPGQATGESPSSPCEERASAPACSSA